MWHEKRKLLCVHYKKPTSTEIILLVFVIGFILFSLRQNKELPVGDYGPTPYENHINSEPIK
jgi:hypothetical protein